MKRAGPEGDCRDLFDWMPPRVLARMAALPTTRLAVHIARLAAEAGHHAAISYDGSDGKSRIRSVVANACPLHPPDAICTSCAAATDGRGLPHPSVSKEKRRLVRCPKCSRLVSEHEWLPQLYSIACLDELPPWSCIRCSPDYDPSVRP